jgi:hypothetical protein
MGSAALKGDRGLAYPICGVALNIEYGLTVALPHSESEAKPDRGIDSVAIEVAVSQSIIDLREHEPGVSIELRRKPPIDGE